MNDTHKVVLAGLYGLFLLHDLPEAGRGGGTLVDHSHSHRARLDAHQAYGSVVGRCRGRAGARAAVDALRGFGGQPCVFGKVFFCL